MYQDRLHMYKKLESELNSKLILYVTGDRMGMEAQIGSDVIDSFVEHLDKIGDSERISLFLYTRGGNTASAWNIVNLLRMFCKELQVIVPHKAHSAGTIISLGANEIIMTKQATLSPIDPSVNTPLNPVLPNGAGYYSVSVEAVKGYLEFAQNEMKINNAESLADIYIKLTDYVHPLVLGQTYRSRAQIQMLAKKLLINQVTIEDDITKIIEFLCSDSGGHDYTINRREARDDLKLKVKNPTQKQYELIKGIYDDVRDELQLGVRFDPGAVNGTYAIRRCLLESVIGGSDYFSTEGHIIHTKISDAPAGFNEAIQNNVTFEGWRHDYHINCLTEDNYVEGEKDDIYKCTDDYQP